MAYARIQTALQENAGILDDLHGLADPNADRLLGWDDSAGAAIAFSVSGGLEFSGTALTINGASITGLNASNLSSGEVADARLSSNVPLKDASNTFSGAVTLNGAVTLGANLTPDADSTRALGTTLVRFSDVFADEINDIAVTDFARLSQAATFTGGNLSAISGTTGNRSLIVQNTTDGTAASSQLYVPNSANRAFRLQVTAPSWSGALLTGGPSGEQAGLSTDSNIPIAFGQNGTAMFWFDTSGLLNTRNVSASEVGFKGAPQNAQSADYTLVLTDAGKTIYYTSSAGDTLTIPANASVAFPVGTIVRVVNNGGGSMTIAVTSDTLSLAGAGTTGSRTLADHGVAVLEKVATTEWFISGAGIS